MMGAIQAMWSEGKSSGEIAEVLGVSRNAVIGQLNKLGLIGFRRGDRATWNAAARSRQAPSPPRTFSWEQRA